MQIAKTGIIHHVYGITPLPPGQTARRCAVNSNRYFLLSCFFISPKRNSLFVSIHALLCNKKDTCADYKDCTDYVEDCGTHATGGRKLGTCLVHNVC